jgi:hypothetical protein
MKTPDTELGKGVTGAAASSMGDEATTEASRDAERPSIQNPMARNKDRCEATCGACIVEPAVHIIFTNVDRLRRL